MLRTALRVIAAVFAILLVTLVAVVAMLQTEAGGRVAARALEAVVSTPGETELRVEWIAPGLPFRLALSGLSLGDGQGEWLALDRLDVRWRPLDLLRGRLTITEALAGGVRLSRLSEGAPEAEEPDTGLSLPSLPLDLRVDRFALDDVEIGPAVAGEAVALRAGGAIAAERDGRIKTDAEIVRTNGVGGGARLAVLWEPASEMLSVNLHADEPEGGRVGSLLGLAGRPPMRLSVTGDGPLGGWDGRIEGAVGEDVGLAARITSEAAPDGTRVHVSGSAQLAALLPEAARPLADEGITFAASLRRAEAGVLVIEAADVDARGVHLAGTGTLALDDERFDGVRLIVTVADATALAPLLAPAGLESAEARFDLSGPWGAPSVAMTADIVNLRLADASVTHSAMEASVAPGDGRGSRSRRTRP
jgi:translocation and assembly module TamB